MNLYAYRATKPHDLALADDPVGARCDEHILEAADEADMVIVATGELRRPTGVAANYRDVLARDRARARAAAMRTAARNRAITALIARHEPEYLYLYESEHVMVAIATPTNQFPTDVGLPPPPRQRAVT